MVDKTQYLDSIDSIVNEKVSQFKNQGASITDRNSLPSTGNYQQNCWFKIPDVICVFVDIRGSTRLSAVSHDSSTAKIYELFTGTAVKIFHAHGASYLDIKGDGVFALFNKNEPYKAFAAAISFKTFAQEKFKPLVNKKSTEIDIGYHMGIDQKTVLVKQVGIKDAEGRDSRKNEVWAGKPINMASKLASQSADGELWVSERYYNNINSDLVRKSCGCNNGEPADEVVDLWESSDLSDDQNFDFNTAYILKSYWCGKHGKSWCSEILNLDQS